ncbi:HDOD domain-containing protein [Dethiosulfatarculus sandiegensis]|nr:HDOD domain-containing protein [Dethiosulfatarculus sandiegensis]
MKTPLPRLPLPGKAGRVMTVETRDAKKRIQFLKSLPTLPGMLDQISRAVESHRFSASDIGKLISKDQVLTAKVLKLANSAFYGFSRKVGSLTQALVLLGFEVIKGLILTSAVFEMMKKKQLGLWEHSLAVALTTGLVAEMSPAIKERREEIALAGLLHDLGKVVIQIQLPHDAESVAELIEVEDMGTGRAEEEVLGFNHCQAGMWLAESWKLPLELTEPIRWHHTPLEAPNASLAAAAVHLADILVKGYGFTTSESVYVPPLQKQALKHLGLNLKAIETVIKMMPEKLGPDVTDSSLAPF